MVGVLFFDQTRVNNGSRLSARMEGFLVIIDLGLGLGKFGRNKELALNAK